VALIERDVVLQGRDENGNQTVDLPVTRLGNIEDTAEVKETPGGEDYVPIMDGDAKGQMKKTPVSALNMGGGPAQYSDAAAYAIGGYCIHDGRLCRCIAAVPEGGEAWNAAHWEETYVSQELKAARTAAGNAQVAADAALEVITKLAHTIDALPAQNGTLTFSGAAQSPRWNSYNPETLTLSGTASAVNAGSYSAVFTPKQGYTWGDGTAVPKTVIWTIGRASISAAPSQSGSLTYTGKAQAPSWRGYDTAKMTVGGTASAVNAGTYTAAFTPTSNYQWSDGSTTAKHISWIIGRASVSAAPSQSGSLTYTGNAQTPSWSGYNAAQLTIGGTASATNAGTYTATFTPTANYQWSDGKTTAKSVNWTVGKAAGSLKLNKTGMTLNGSARSGVIAVTRAGDGAVSASSSNTGVASVSVSGTTVTVTGKAYGTVTVTVKVAAGTNHTAPAAQACSVTVNVFDTSLANNSWAAIRAASDAGEAPNFWSVGDTKTITINGTVQGFNFSNLSVSVFILGFNHNSAYEGGSRIHFQIGKIGATDVALCDSQYGKNGSGDGFRMNKSLTSDGGWNSSYMRNFVLGNSGTPANPVGGSLMAALPSDLRAVMKSTTKYTDNTGGGSDTASYVTATTDYLFLLAEYEVLGIRHSANSAEQNYQRQYDYYKAGNSLVAYNHTAVSTAVWWLLRSHHCPLKGYFLRGDQSGGTSLVNGYCAGGLRPGFSV